LASSEKVIIAKAEIATTALSGKDLDSDQLAKEITQKGSQAVCVNKLDDLRKAIDAFSEPDAVLLILSNRTCLGLWESSFVQELKA
jgi:UDP-N-acetylmuramate: L-alanyl-gamma-D-glutamyl-meso-diaminopimelate ligase